MGFIKGKVKDFYLLTTDVENIFINEYLPAAPGDYVKVYLYGLLYAQTGADMDARTFAQQLRLPDETIRQAWEYWESMGAVRRVKGKSGGADTAVHAAGMQEDIEFRNLRAMMYGNGGMEDEDADAADVQHGGKPGKLADRLCDSSVKEFIQALESRTGRLFDPQKELAEILSWEHDFGTTKEVILEAFSYCYERQKTGLSYIKKVVMGWTEQGLTSRETVEAYLKENSIRQSMYKRVLQSLGLNRGATEAEKRLMNVWFDEMHCSLERVLEACDRTLSAANPNLRYVNKVLENWYEEAKARGLDVNQKTTVTQAVLNQYYEFLRRQAEETAQAHKREIYKILPRAAEIDAMHRELGSKLTKGMLTGMKAPQKAQLKQEMRALEEERAVLLTEHNYPMDYTDIKYACEKCSDTGFDENGMRCSCVRQRTGEAEVWQKRDKQTS